MTENICGPYSQEDFRVMSLLKRQIHKMETKPSIFEDMLLRDKDTLKVYLKRVS